jgi:hypothetical protein
MMSAAKRSLNDFQTLLDLAGSEVPKSVTSDTNYVQSSDFDCKFYCVAYFRKLIKDNCE